MWEDNAWYLMISRGEWSMTISDEITPNQDQTIDILNNYDFC